MWYNIHRSLAPLMMSGGGMEIFMEYILASGSPRRAELLKGLGLQPRIVPAEIDESAFCDDEPTRMVTKLAMMKALHTAKRYSGKSFVCIGADTCVYIDGKILGKPKDEKEAEEMLALLSGKWHSVFTGYAVVNCETMEACGRRCETKVKFKELSQEEIKAYVKSGEPMDKAGAYGIQEKGALFIERIDGDYFNVVGLPLCELEKTLKKEFGISLIDTK